MCNEVNKQFNNRKSTDIRSEKTAHAIDVCDMIRKLDVNEMPLFVMDSVSFANLLRMNAEDVSYVAVADKLADISAKIDLMNDSISMNAVRSIANADRIQNINNNGIDSQAAQHNRQRWSRQASFTVPTPNSAAMPQSNCRIGGITDVSYADQLKLTQMRPNNLNSIKYYQQQLNVNKTVPNEGAYNPTDDATSDAAHSASRQQQQTNMSSISSSSSLYKYNNL